MNLAQFPRRRYTENETPLEFLPRFTMRSADPMCTLKETTSWA